MNKILLSNILCLFLYSIVSCLSPKYSCKELNQLIDTKYKYVNKLKEKISLIEHDNLDLNSETIENNEYQIHVLSLISKDLDIAESLMKDGIKIFAHTLGEISSNVKSVKLLKGVSQIRLEILRSHIFVLEEEVNDINEYIKSINSQQHAHNLIQSQLISEQLIGELFISADQLEEELHHDLFNSFKKQGKAIETVIRIRSSQIENEEYGISYLIDTKDNRYVLSRPDDPTISREDIHLITDLALVLSFSSIFSFFLLILGIPQILGPIITGILLGPSCLDILSSIVQIESIGEFGILFVFFSLGLEFSPDNLKKVWRISLYGSHMIAASFITMGIMISLLFSFPTGEFVFVFFAFSLSSTPLVIRLFQKTKYPSYLETEPSFSKNYVLGILIIQEIQFSLFMAVIPLSFSIKSQGLFQIVFLLIVKAFALISLLLFEIKFFNGPVIEYLMKKLDKPDLQANALVLYSIFVSLAFFLISHKIGFSSEVSCLLAGLGMNSIKNVNSMDIFKSKFECLTQLFSILFFCSVGFHIFPSFLLQELNLILLFTSFVYIFKFFIIFTVEFFLYRNPDYFDKSSRMDLNVLLGMSCISDFVFLLGTRARRIKLISREMHLLMISCTSLILITVPILFWIKSLYSRLIMNFKMRFYK